jgi:chromosome segregation ATPase
MMKGKLKILGALAAGVLGANLLAQPQQPGATVAERVLALERDVASLSTRVELRDAQRTPVSDATLTSRVQQLEQSLNRLTLDLQRVERQADSALREASQARRDAESAQRAVQSLESRVR